MREQIAEVKKKITATETALADCNVRISDAERKIEKLRAGMPTPPNRKDDREDLLAEIAIGNAKDSDLIAFDRETAAVMKAHDAAMSKIHSESAPIEGSCAGLKRKARKLTAELETLRADYRSSVQALCDVEMERVAERYVRATHDVMRYAAEALAWSGIKVRMGGSSEVGMVIAQEMLTFIPLGTQADRGNLPATDPASTGKVFDKVDDEIVAALKVEGIPVPNAPRSSLSPTKGKTPKIEETPEPVTGRTFMSSFRPEENRFPDGHVRPARAITE